MATWLSFYNGVTALVDSRIAGGDGVCRLPAHHLGGSVLVNLSRGKIPILPFVGL